jgi:hypothetical protein
VVLVACWLAFFYALTARPEPHQSSLGGGEMLKREFFEALEKRGYKVSATVLGYAIDRGYVDRPERPDGWYDYSEATLEQFIAYLQRTARRRTHIPGMMAGNGPKPGRPRKTQSAS